MSARERLRHDVGKYLVRVACNLRPGPVPGVLIELLLRDLYESPGGGRPSARFAQLASAIDRAAAAQINERFAALDALEAKTRAGDPIALRRAADLALEIGRVLDTALEAA